MLILGIKTLSRGKKLLTMLKKTVNTSLNGVLRSII